MGGSAQSCSFSIKPPDVGVVVRCNARILRAVAAFLPPSSGWQKNGKLAGNQVFRKPTRISPLHEERVQHKRQSLLRTCQGQPFARLAWASSAVSVRDWLYGKRQS